MTETSSERACPLAGLGLEAIRVAMFRYDAARGQVVLCVRFKQIAPTRIPAQYMQVH